MMGEFQSGQMGQTVNLLAKPSEVRILPLPHVIIRGSSSFGRATAFQAVGGGFEPRFPLEFNPSSNPTDFFILNILLFSYFLPKSAGISPHTGVFHFNICVV